MTPTSSWCGPQTSRLLALMRFGTPRTCQMVRCRGCHDRTQRIPGALGAGGHGAVASVIAVDEARHPPPHPKPGLGFRV